MSDYYEECECCGKEVHITGGYIGTFSEVYCVECGFWGDYCGLKCCGDDSHEPQYEKGEN